MKKIFLAIISFCIALSVNAQEWVGISKSSSTKIQETLISSSENKVVVDVKIDGFYKQAVRTSQGEQLVISGEGMAYMPVKGAPNLPMYPISMIVGDNAEMEVSVVKSEYVDFENIEVAPSKGNFVIKLCVVNVDVAEFGAKHTASNIHAHDVRDDLIAQISGEPYHASSTGVNVRHNADFAIGKRRLFKQSVNLSLCLFVNRFCEDFQVFHGHFLINAQTSAIAQTIATT